jgi:hypothetical protein
MESTSLMICRRGILVPPWNGCNLCTARRSRLTELDVRSRIFVEQEKQKSPHFPHNQREEGTIALLPFVRGNGAVRVVVEVSRYTP